MRDRVRKLLKWVISPPAPSHWIPDQPPARLKRDDLSWLCAPTTMSDPAAWDQYWIAQIEHHVPAFNDIFCDDGELVDTMRASAFRTILCVGSGISLEPQALAAAGFDVTALDLSPAAAFFSHGARTVPDYLRQLLSGRDLRRGGVVRFVTGDLRDPAMCPGPFDVVIERCTLQLFPDDERPAALTAVANRLAPRGIFFSQCHDRTAGPVGPRRHASASWFEQQGWSRWPAQTPLAERVVWLMVTSG
jgi:SAM-dependent methyltransferase